MDFIGSVDFSMTAGNASSRARRKRRPGLLIEKHVNVVQCALCFYCFCQAC